jgi:hypothetical protein
LKYQDHYEILQLRPSQLTPDILAEKNPIIVEGCADSANDMVESSLKYMYLYKYNSKYEPKPDTLTKNYAKYLVLHSDKTCIIEIVNPKYNDKEYQSVPIKIKPNTYLILPNLWKYKSEQEIECIFVHDVFSAIHHTTSTII